MMNTAYPQFGENSLNGLVKRRYQQSQQDTPVRGVLQDKPRATTDPRSLSPAWNGKNTTRARPMDINTFRLQNPIKKHSNKRRKKKVNIWLDPPEIAKLMAKAKSEGLSISSTGAAYIKRGMQEEADIQYSAFIQPIIETLIRNELRRYFSRMISFQARITMTLDVIKGLVKWLCRKLAGATKEQVDAVEVRSRTDARVNLQTRTQQLEKLTAEYEKELMEGTN